MLIERNIANSAIKIPSHIINSVPVGNPSNIPVFFFLLAKPLYYSITMQYCFIAIGLDFSCCDIQQNNLNDKVLESQIFYLETNEENAL